MNQAKPFRTAMKYGILGGLLLVIVSLIFYLIGQQESKLGSYIGYAVLIAMIVLGMLEYRNKELGGTLTFGQGLGLGTLISVIMGVIAAIWSMIYFNVIDPDFINMLTSKTEIQMEERGLSDEEIEQAMSMTKFFMNPLIFSLFAIVAYSFLGFIISLIASAILKRETPVHQ